MATPLVTVLTPTYNHARYISRCIQSLQNQTYQHWELIVIDDGSTDNTVDVVRQFQDPRITLLQEKHRGVEFLAETLNIGLRRGSGSLVTALMSDDIWPPYRLEKQVPVFEDPSVVLSFGWGHLIDEQDNTIAEFKLPKFVTPVMNRPVGSVLKSLLASNWIPEYTELISRKALENIGGYLQPPPLLAEDYPTHLALALEGEFRYLDLPLGYYRMHPQQQTRLHIFEMDKRDGEMVMEFYRRLPPEAKELSGWTEPALAKHLQSQLNNAFFREGRRMLLNGHWSGARVQFVKALIAGNAYTKAKAVAGLACGLLRRDAEWLARATGKPPLR